MDCGSCILAILLTFYSNYKWLTGFYVDRSRGAYFISIGMINLVQSQHGGKFLVDKCPDNIFNCLVGPFLERFFQSHSVQTPCDNVDCASITGELALQCFGCCCLCGIVSIK